MKLSTQVKSISYLKAHAADVVYQVREQKEPMIITQNGEAKMVVQDIESFERTQELLAMLKILAHIRKNSWSMVFGTTGRSTSNPIESFTASR